MARHQLHPRRQKHDFPRGTVASGATGAKARALARHQLHPTRQKHEFPSKTVAPSAVGNKKPARTRHQLHPTRHKHDNPSKTVASGAIGATVRVVAGDQLHPTRQIQAFRHTSVAPSAVGALATEEKPLDRSKNQRLIDSKALASRGTYCVRRSQGLVSSDRRFSYWYSTLYRITLSTPIS